MQTARLLASVGSVCASGLLLSVLIIHSFRSNSLAVLEEEEEPKNYYTTAFPPGFRKNIGPGLSFGDPVLNKYNKFRYVLPCEKKGNCWKPEDEAYLHWKDLKQDAPSSDAQMLREFDYMVSQIDKGTKDCEEGFEGDDEAIKKCSDKEVRQMCYRYEALSHICDESTAGRNNEAEGTKYWDSSYELKACTSDSRKALTDKCKESEKLPGVNVMHWPWMGHTGIDQDP